MSSSQGKSGGESSNCNANELQKINKNKGDL